MTAASSVKAARASLTFHRTLTPIRANRWRWRLVAANGRVVAASSEGYANRADAERNARLVVGGGYIVTVDGDQ